MAKKSSKDYFGITRVVSLILAIIPITSCVLGIITRLTEGKIVAALLRFLLGWNIIWIVDIIMMALHGRIWRLINC